ncbi:hypothetical protein JQT66_04465 [Sulfitobacter mediterraneus]|uniref:hypothetical protein n=1 Tax=Sulfitobacter mediterraneus TaxID=83219 RepID=UPI0019321888|nr:hypothetical protein [Sulfitobacter mediterraneus]MBM1309065.1 hypothetical protein [Sulfitobacter mediterraneus]MBM1312949.1 hypothetical protein [Sulfitobacter mediterraneus]MBM1321332.1 hypothetical protein [Sulfitobacter mediterraneus]MBM1325219.1 hypothetical protein [Sulfitobacter mediterraneus]MBM1396566.1 hypothetical protein [Sulfitobacter mediterraneus]
MTDINAVQANDPAHPKTRAQLQDDALVIKTLLNTVMAMAFTSNVQDTMTVVEMAHDRAEQLNRDLDSVNMHEVVA